MLTQEQRDQAVKLLGTSADDCEQNIMRSVEINPYSGLIEAASALVHANQTNRMNKAHRQALMKAGRKALKDLGEI
ncbi:MAG: hypothetical protein SVX28_11675 [Pseudomonadota bacterium]|nr:hypothetical protein [Pseudomonadota bacterium]